MYIYFIIWVIVQYYLILLKCFRFWLDSVAHACYLRTLGGQGRWITWVQEFKISLGNVMKPFLYQKYKKISWVWWCTSVFPAIQEAEVRGSPEPRKLGLQWAEIAPLPSTRSQNRVLSTKQDKTKKQGRAQWLTSIIPALWEVQVGGSLEAILVNMVKPRLY